MTPFSTKLKTPEEVELEKKLSELAGLNRDVAEREKVFAELKYEIRLFERRYEEILGHRITLLEELEWQINGLLGLGEKAENQPLERPQPDPYAFFHHKTDLLDDVEPFSAEPQKSFKTLYRDVAKTIHPDLAPDNEDRARRQELMAVANKAYAEGDRKTLEDILAEWITPIQYGSELDIAMALVKAIRDIARAKQDIYAVGLKIEELQTTDIYQFKLKVDDAASDGIDLLAEMGNAVERDIAKAEMRLSLLRGDFDADSPKASVLPLETRFIKFPLSTNALVYERSRGSVDFREWKRIGAAKGVIEVLLDKEVRLDAKSGANCDISWLLELNPNDIQSLFLYNIDDTAFPLIANMTGLEELYLSNTTVTDKGLLQLMPLSSLRRLYLYHTPVSDVGLLYLSKISDLKSITLSGTNVSEEGLERFRIYAPGCKAVNFKWRYEN